MTWYEVDISDRDMFEDIPYTPYLAKKITDIFLGKGLWITRKNENPLRISINRKLLSKSNKSEWGNVCSGIFQINIIPLDDGWFRVEVIEPLAYITRGWRENNRVQFYKCDQELGVRDLMISLGVINKGD